MISEKKKGCNKQSKMVMMEHEITLGRGIGERGRERERRIGKPRNGKE